MSNYFVAVFRPKAHRGMEHPSICWDQRSGPWHSPTTFPAPPSLSVPLSPSLPYLPLSSPSAFTGANTSSIPETSHVKLALCLLLHGAPGSASSSCLCSIAPSPPCITLLGTMTGDFLLPTPLDTFQHKSELTRLFSHVLDKEQPLAECGQKCPSCSWASPCISGLSPPPLSHSCLQGFVLGHCSSHSALLAEDHIPCIAAPGPIDWRLPRGHRQLDSSHRSLDGPLCLRQWCRPGNILKHNHPDSLTGSSGSAISSLSHPAAAPPLFWPLLFQHPTKSKGPALLHLSEDATASVFLRFIYVLHLCFHLLATAFIGHLFLNHSNMHGWYPGHQPWAPSGPSLTWPPAHTTCLQAQPDHVTLCLPLAWLPSPTAVVLYLGRTWESHGTASKMMMLRL